MKKIQIESVPKYLESLKKKMEAYHHDIDIDIDEYNDNLKTPFIHVLRLSGTYQMMLWPIEKYPKYGEEVPYYFGHAKREHILKSNCDCCRHIFTIFSDAEKFTYRYYNGINMYLITKEEMLTIINDYERKIKAQFELDKRKVS